MKRFLKILGLLVVALVGLFWAGTHIWVPDLVKAQAAKFGERVGYKISVADVALSPLLLKADVSGIELSTPNGQHLLKLSRLSVDANFWPLLAGKVSLANLSLDEPELVLARADADSKGKSTPWNWAQFVSAVDQATRSTDTEAAPKSDPVKLAVESLAIRGARLSVRDGTKNTPINLGPMNLTVEGFSNQDAAGEVGGLRSGYTVNLGAVKIPLPATEGMPSRELVFKQVVASGRADRKAHEALALKLDLGLDDGKIRTEWQINDSKAEINGAIGLEKLALSPWLAVLPSYQRLLSPTGSLSGDFKFVKSNEGLVLDGSFAIADLNAQLEGKKETLLGWSNATVSQLHLALPVDSNKAPALSINEIAIDRPDLRFIISAQRMSNFREVFSKPEPVKQVNEVSAPATDASITKATPAQADTTVAAVPAQSTPAKPAVKVAAKSATKGAPEFRFDIHSVRLKNGFMHFADESIKPVFRVDVKDLNGSLLGISNGPGQYASLALDGRAARTGSLKIRGQLAFADPRQNNDVTLIFKNIPLNTTNPYTMTFAGYPIDDGRIDVNLRYVTKDGQLQGKNRFVIKKIKLGEPVPDYQGTRLPLGLAIALLEDSDGMIDVNIPVSGNVNEPEFSVGHLVWQAVKTVLSNIVTAPFRALGALLGIENMDAIAFVPGESALPLEGDEQLTKISEYLAKRPKAKLVIHGTYDPAVDSAELARAMADKAILEASGLKVVPGEPLPTPNLTDPKVKAGLKSAYGAQVGRIKLGQRLLTLPDNAERDTQLRQELIQSYKITDEQLKQLAAQRADAVKRKLLAGDGKLADRVVIGDPESVSADNAGVPIKVTLETGS